MCGVVWDEWEGRDRSWCIRRLWGWRISSGGSPRHRTYRLRPMDVISCSHIHMLATFSQWRRWTPEPLLRRWPRAPGRQATRSTPGHTPARPNHTRQYSPRAIGNLAWIRARPARGSFPVHGRERHWCPREYHLPAPRTFLLIRHGPPRSNILGRRKPCPKCQEGSRCSVPRSRVNTTPGFWSFPECVRRLSLR